MKFILLILGIVIYGNAAMYSASVMSLYQEGNPKAIGRLLPSVEVEIIKEVDGKKLLAFEGYIQESVPNAIYFVPNRRILVAGIAKSAQYDYKLIERVNDEGSEWLKIRVEFLCDGNDFIDDVESLYTRAKEMFSDNCSICHKLHDSKEFNANQWPSVLNSMLSRTGISKAESYLLIQYLQKNAKDMPK